MRTFQGGHGPSDNFNQFQSEEVTFCPSKIFSGAWAEPSLTGCGINDKCITDITENYAGASPPLDCEGKSRKFKSLNFLVATFIMRLLHILYLITSVIYFISFKSTKLSNQKLGKFLFLIPNDSKSFFNKSLIEPGF